MTELPILDLAGDPRDRGRAHGRAMAASIRANVETYLRRFAAGGLEPAEARAAAKGWAPVFEREAPDYAEEMAGIAEGAEVPLADIVLLNARYEITYTVFSGEATAGKGTEEAAPDGCTSFGLLPAATASGHTVIGQNWDWLAAVQGHCLVTRVTRKDRPDFVGFTEAGIAGCKFGVNEAGLGLAVNGLVTPRDGANRHMRPFHLRCRDILDADRFDRAIAAVVSTPRTCSTNFLIGHADGEIIDIEATPDACAYIYPQGGIVTHANHLEAETRVASLFERLSPHSLFRGARLRRRLEEAGGRIDEAAIETALCDHFSRPGSICRHPDPLLAEAMRVTTVAAAIIDLNARVLRVTAGPPCEHAFQTVGLARQTAFA